MNEPDPDGETCASVLAALAVVCCLAGAVILARDQCWIQWPTWQRVSVGSPTPIEQGE